MVKNFIAKIVLLGDGGVGKTSLVRRFVENKYSDEYISTIGSKTSKKVIKYPDFFVSEDINLKLMIVDIHGQKTFSSLHASNYLGSKGALVVFDQTRPDSFENIDEWIEGLYDVVDEIPLVILGNKNDLIEGYWSRETKDQSFDEYIRKNHSQILEFYERNPEFGDIPEFEPVDRDLIEDYSEKNDITFFITSAKTGKNVEEAFHLLGKNILINMKERGKIE